MTTSTAAAPGYVGNLNSSQQKKLQQLWRILLQSWDPELSSSELDTRSLASDHWLKKTHRRVFSFSRSLPRTTEVETPSIPANLLSSLKSLGAGANELKAVQSLLTKVPGEKLRAAFLTLLKQDHPDALLLRFLRAEKWDVPKAWIKFVTALNWRVNEYKVDEEVLLKGEAYFLRKSHLIDAALGKKDAESFMLQLRIGKGILHGVDREGRPIFVIRARTHEPGAQTLKGLNDYIVHCIETMRILMVSPVETMVRLEGLSVSQRP